MATELQWKQFIEGMRLGDVGPFRQVNVVSGDDCIREYRDGDAVVATMIVYGSNTSNLGQECERMFYIIDDCLCPDIHILTAEESIEWDEFDGDDEQWLLDHGQIL